MCQLIAQYPVFWSKLINLILPSRHLNKCHLTNGSGEGSLGMTQLRSDRGRHPDSPDTAYGWVVVTSSLFVMLATSELVAGFGILYTPYAEAFNTDRATTGWISSLLMFTSGVAGISLFSCDPAFKLTNCVGHLF